MTMEIIVKTPSLVSVSEVKNAPFLKDIAILSNTDIQTEITEVEEEIFSEFGDPVKKAWTIVDSAQYIYDLGYNRLYSIPYIEITGSRVGSHLYAGSLVPTSGSVVFDLNNGYIALGSNLVGSYAGQRMEWNFVPWRFHQLAMEMSRLRMLELDVYASGKETKDPKVETLMKRVDKTKMLIRSESSLVGTTNIPERYGDRQEGEYIFQDTLNFY